MLLKKAFILAAVFLAVDVACQSFRIFIGGEFGFFVVLLFGVFMNFFAFLILFFVFSDEKTRIISYVIASVLVFRLSVDVAYNYVRWFDSLIFSLILLALLSFFGFLLYRCNFFSRFSRLG